MLYHRGWLNAVEIARSGMQASLLVIHPETEVGFVLINALLSSYFEVFINVLFYISFYDPSETVCKFWSANFGTDSWMSMYATPWTRGKQRACHISCGKVFVCQRQRFTLMTFLIPHLSLSTSFKFHMPFLVWKQYFICENVSIIYVKWRRHT